MPRSIHAFMQDTNYRNAVIRKTEVNDMPLNGSSPISTPNVVARHSRLWHQHKVGELARQTVHIAISLFHAPLLPGVQPDRLQVTFRRRG